MKQLVLYTIRQAHGIVHCFSTDPIYAEQKSRSGYYVNASLKWVVGR